MKKFIDQNRDFFEPIITIALPLALQNLITASLNMVDTVIIGQLGQVAIAAVGLANQLFFLLNLLLFGINSGAAIFMAQFWGRKDVQNIRRVLGITLMTGIAASLLFTLTALFFPQVVMKVFTNDPAVIGKGSDYLRIISFSYVIMAVSFSFTFVLRSIGQVMLPVKISCVAWLANTILNYALIYGYFGFPKLGVAGSALATVIARTLEAALFVGFIYHRQLVPAAKLKELLDVNLAFVAKFFKTTLPVILNETLWALGVTLFSVVYAHMGTSVIAGVNIFSTLERVAFVLFMGLAQACAVTIGNDIGAGAEEKAFTRAKQAALFGPLFSITIGLGLVLLSNPILSLFKISATTAEITRQILRIFALVLPFKVFNLIICIGVLRSGGDTRYSLMLDTGALWLIAVPVSFLAGLVWHLPPSLVYLLVALEEIFKFCLGIQRLLSRKWMNNLTHEMRETVNITPAPKKYMVSD